jgi:hypothetical protein
MSNKPIRSFDDLEDWEKELFPYYAMTKEDYALMKEQERRERHKKKKLMPDSWSDEMKEAHDILSDIQSTQSTPLPEHMKDEEGRILESAYRMIENQTILEERRKLREKNSTAAKNSRKKSRETVKLETEIRTLWHQLKMGHEQRELAAMIHKRLSRPVSIQRVREIIRALNLRNS